MEMDLKYLLDVKCSFDHVH